MAKTLDIKPASVDILHHFQAFGYITGEDGAGRPLHTPAIDDPKQIENLGIQRALPMESQNLLQKRLRIAHAALCFAGDGIEDRIGKVQMFLIGDPP